MNSAFITFRCSRHFLSLSSSLIFCSMRFSRRRKETVVASTSSPPASDATTKRGMPLPESTMSAPRSFWSIPAMMPSILGLTTTNGSTARGASSPVKPANCLIVLLVQTDLPAGLPTTKGNTKRGVKPATRALHITLLE